MKKTKVKCPDCNRYISSNQFYKHKNSKQCLLNQKMNSVFIDEKWLLPNGKYKCPDCGAEIARNCIRKHIGSKTCLRNQKNGLPQKTKGICPHCGLDYSGMTDSEKANHSRWCKKNPKRKEYVDALNTLRPAIGHTAWNKGLTKKTDERIKKAGEKLSERYKNGELVGSFKGKTHSDETKELLRKIALESDHQRVSKRTKPYTKTDGTVVMLDSNWERIVAKELDNEGIIWERPTPLKWIDANNVEHNYFSDFYIPQWDVYLDPKSDYTELKQKEKIDYLLTHYDNIFILKEHQLNVESIKKVIGI